MTFRTKRLEELDEDGPLLLLAVLAVDEDDALRHAVHGRL
jgi:hypothetical protein